MTFKQLKRTQISLFLFIFCFYTSAFAQLDSIEDSFLSGFSEDGRIKVLLLKLSTFGSISETAAEEYVRAFQRHLSNTNHFTVVGPEEYSNFFQSDPISADCHDIACGIQIGKRLNADKVITGQLRRSNILNEDGLEVPNTGLELSIRLMDVLTNTTDFTDSVQFTDADMPEQLFELSNRISRNTQIRGHVLSTENRNIVIDLGRAHGLGTGDRVVVYQQSSATNLEGDTLGLEQKNIAVAEINRLNNMSSDAVILYHYQLPEEGDFFKTYINRQKQVELVENTRRELDTKKRLTRRKKPLNLTPEVIDTITGEPIPEGKEDWERRLAKAQADERRWMYYGLGAGAGLILLLSKRIELSDNMQQIATLGLAIGAGYSGYRFFKSRNDVNAIKAEGRVKKFTFQLRPKGIQLALNYQF